jgi:hypothetical protein
MSSGIETPGYSAQSQATDNQFMLFEQLSEARKQNGALLEERQKLLREIGGHKDLIASWERRFDKLLNLCTRID